MLMTIRYQNGLRMETVVLAADSERMRVVIDSQRDTMELHKAGECWYTEDGEEIEVEALIPLEGINIANSRHPLVTAAGHGYR
jgi:hypothetical protein